MKNENEVLSLENKDFENALNALSLLLTAIDAVRSKEERIDELLKTEIPIETRFNFKATLLLEGTIEPRLTIDEIILEGVRERCKTPLIVAVRPDSIEFRFENYTVFKASSGKTTLADLIRLAAVYTLNPTMFEELKEMLCQKIPLEAIEEKTVTIAFLFQLFSIP